MKIDRMDERLLARVQENARLSAATLGEELGLSEAAVQRRLKRMREDGVIRREVAIVDGAEAGFGQTLIVSIELERESPDIHAAFQQKLQADPHVQQCWYVTGEADYMAVMQVRDMAHFDDIARSLLMDDARVKRFRTSVSMRTVKSSLELPLLP